MLNEDNSHFFYTRGQADITPDIIDEWVDQYAGTQVRELVISPNSMRTSYDSDAWEPIWRGYDPAGSDDQPLFESLPPERRAASRRWVHAAWAIHRMGIDVYERWIARARRAGISPWLSMRMNDVHDADNERSFMHSRFWRDNPEFRRVRYRFSNWVDRAFDYGRPEVRKHHLKLLRELLDRYDPDGLELDWMRFGFHFRPGFEQEGSVLLTGFMQEVRELVVQAEQKRGHGIAVSTRVPSCPGTALALGMDAVSWARRGLIDWLVPTPFWATVETDMPIDLWKETLEGTGVKLAPGLELNIRSHPEMKIETNTLDTVRGTASGFIERGIDRLYLFNYMDSQTTIRRHSEYPRLIREAGSLTTMAGKLRRHVVTYADTWAPGEPVARLLPATIGPGKWSAFRLLCGPAPDQNRPAFVVLFTSGEVAGTSLTLFVNGNQSERCDTEPHVPPPKPDLPPSAWRIPTGTLKSGYNLIELCADTDLTVEWVEVLVIGDP